MIDLNEKIKILLKENHEALSKLEEWITTQPHIPKNIPKTILFRYYKVCHFDLEETKKLIDINVKFRINHQYFLANRDIKSKELQRAISNVQYSAFPKLTKEGYAIESYRIINSNINDFILQDIFKFVVMVNDVHALMEPDTNGLVSIYDAKGYTFSHFMKFVSNLSSLRHFSQYGQEASCVELKQIHFVNCSQILTKVVAFLKPLISDELSKKFYFHTSGFETLHELIDKNCLPTDYGGCGRTLEQYAEDTLSNVHKYHDFLSKNENFFLLNYES